MHLLPFTIFIMIVEKSKEINSLDELRKGIKTQRELIEKSVAKVKEKLDSSFDSDIEVWLK